MTGLSASFIDDFLAFLVLLDNDLSGDSLEVRKLSSGG